MIETVEGATRSGGQELRNVGIFAHVDAGKTTTTEQMLFRSGRIRSLGKVDDGTTQTDWLEVERERGISVRSAVTRFEWHGVQVNLVDTPGHVDFLSEVERSLRVMDGAVLIVSAVEGVQAQTEVIWQALRELRIPTLLYVNKMDRVGANAEGTLTQLRRLLSEGITPVQAPCGSEDLFVGSQNLLEVEVASEDSVVSAYTESFRRRLDETVAEQSDELLTEYLDKGTLPLAKLLPSLKAGIFRSELFPVFFGASGRGIGVESLMDAIVELLPAPHHAGTKGEVSGVVFKLDKDPVMGRVAYIRLYEGTIRNRDILLNHSLGITEKVTQIRRTEGQRSSDIGLLEAGDIAAVYGLSRARIGDIMGSPNGVPGGKRLAEPLLTVQVNGANPALYPAVVAAFQELADEDPYLDLQWLQEERELHLKVMGPIQVEVLTSIVHSRFGLDVTFGEPSVIYKETLVQAGEGYVAYTMPKPCWAILRFRMEPGERGSGIRYESLVRSERLLDSYQNEVARRVPEALQQGLLGWEVTDLKVTLIEGEHHVWHTHPLDFVVAPPMGIMDGLMHTGTKLLEPMLKFRLSAPEEFGGKLMSELVVMRGTFEVPIVRGERMEIEGRLPVATSLDFPARLGSLTRGRGTLATSFDGYEEAPQDVKAERRRRGVNPLDTSKYILATRNALSQI